MNSVEVDILDNNPDFLKLMEIVLSDHFTVKTTTDTNKFIGMVKQPAVLVLDWYLDYGILGIDVMQRVLKTNPLCFTIFVSSMASVDVLLRIIDEGERVFFIRKDSKTDFFTELVEKINRAKVILKKSLLDHDQQLRKEELLREKITEALKAIDKTSDGKGI